MEQDSKGDLKQLELEFLKIARAFSSSPEGGAFFLKYILLPDSTINNEAIDKLYEEMIEQFATQQELAQSIVQSLQYLREQSLVNVESRNYIEQQINNIIHYKALNDYASDTDPQKFLNIFT